MIRPHLQDESLLADVVAARHDPDALHLWWLGQSGFLAQWQGRHLLLDPYLSDSLTRKYAATDKPHTRLSERVISPERLDFIDVVTSSHTHTDHLDPETLRPLGQANPALILVCPEANRELARERSGLPDARIVGLDAGPMASGGAVSTRTTTVAVAGFEVHAIPAAHEKLDTDGQGRHLCLGYVVKAGPWVLYHSGDTMLYDGLVDRLRPFRVEVALLPINGRAPERRVAGNLWGREAAWLAREIGAGVVIPCHYDLFEFNTATPDEFMTECDRLGQRGCVLRLGERWTAGGR